jgi:sugar phosphate isomerase/epimerase
MSKIYVQPPDHHEFDEFLHYATDNYYNMEIASFAYSAILDTTWQEILKNHQQSLKGFTGKISLHGAYLDLAIHSRDRKVKKVAEERILHNLEIAHLLNAQYVVFHGNFNPLIRYDSYRKNWVEQNATFWSDILDKYACTVLLENLWEPHPDIFRELLDMIASEQLKICFDRGHAHIFSQVAFEEWIAVLHTDIAYMHVNDNNKDIDSELVPGDGSIDWQEFSRLIKRYDITPEIVFEVGTLEKTRKSLQYFKERNLYPFQKK